MMVKMIQGKASWTPDASQREIIGISSGCHLVLAPPGCGKTQILAERIRLALDSGVNAEDMLCLTFTNRAARGMRERINERVGESESEGVFVGNVHRFCSRFLFENGIVPSESAIIDDDTTTSILARYLGEDEDTVNRDFRRKQAYSQIMFFAHLMYDVRHGLPKSLRMHPECVTREDIAVMKAISEARGSAFDARMMVDIYDNTDFYLDLVRQPSSNRLLAHEAEQTLMKMRYAHAYDAYKRQNNLIDFEDLLQLTYTALAETPGHKRYPWVQVDEVQDLNMLQLAIIRGVSASAEPPGNQPCLMFLGDEQQAIFSFMGAKLTTLNTLKEQCEGNIHHLGVNHRSPRQLLEMLNTYAVSNLGSDPRLLPVAALPDDAPAAADGQPTCAGMSPDEPGALCISPYPNIHAEFEGVANHAAALVDKYRNETTAIIVNSNRDADDISKILDLAGHAHFKVSGTDLFSTPELKLLTAHLSVIANDMNFLAWSRIMQGMRVCDTPASARRFVHQLRSRAILPSDLLLADSQTYLRRFLDIYANSDIVVFDTETTGLDVFADDIIQIAAERIRNGVSVAKFSVHIETAKPIPHMLGDVVNPIIEGRKRVSILPHAEALRMFLHFVGDDALLAHNAEFDFHIMEHNLRRYLGIPTPSDNGGGSDDGEARRSHATWNGGREVFDSLKLIRLLRPDLKAFKLKALLAELGLQGTNSHLADDDVDATISLVAYCYRKGMETIPSQDEFLSRKSTIEHAGRLRRNYAAPYNAARSRLYDRTVSDSGVPALVDEMRGFYHWLVDTHWIRQVDKIHYVFSFLTSDIIDEREEPSLKEQLDHHIMELSTFKEADLCGSTAITDRLFISTIHKAKGLEFDNVMVLDAVEGRIPNFYHENNAQLLAEDARKLYVAMSRAKRRLYVCYSRQGTSSAMPERKLSRFMEPVMGFFKT